MKKVNTDRRKAVSSLMLDIAKLTFASFILGGILLGELPQYILIAIGFVVTIGCALLGIFITPKTEEKE